MHTRCYAVVILTSLMVISAYHLASGVSVVVAEDDGLPAQTVIGADHLALEVPPHPVKTNTFTPPSTQGLHLAQRFDITVASHQPVPLQDQDLYAQGKMLAMRSGKSWLLIRDDLQTAWFMDDNRHAISTIPVSRLKTGLPTVGKNMPPLPSFRSTGESKTIAGYACQVYRGALNDISAEACVTRELATLERLQTRLGMRPEVPGIPLELIVTVQQPGKERVTFTQRVTRVTVGPVDPALFTPPTTAPENR